MSRDYSKSWKKFDGNLVITPEGFVDSLVFETRYFGKCGQAELGMGIHLKGNDGGGVLTNDDLLALHTAITDHFKRLSKELAEANQELPQRLSKTDNHIESSQNAKDTK